jgi:hypothetical protein
MSVRRLSSRTAANSNVLPISGYRDAASLSGLVGWYDCSDAAYMATATNGTGSVSNSSAVAWLRDRSASGLNVTQGTANNRPAFTTSGINGLGSLSLNGTTHSLTNATVPLPSASAISVFGVFTRTSAAAGLIGSYGYFFGDTYRANAFRNFTIWNPSNTAPPWTATDNQVLNTPYVVVMTMRATQSWCLVVWRNGTVVNSSQGASILATLTASQSVSLGVGQVNFTNVFHAGLLGEVGFYNRELTAAEAVALGRGLGAKWGVTVA